MDELWRNWRAKSIIGLPGGLKSRLEQTHQETQNDLFSPPLAGDAFHRFAVGFQSANCLRRLDGCRLFRAGNQLSGLVLILMLWLGDGLGDLKLDIAAAMLLLNLLCGGPLMSILSIGILGSLRVSKQLPAWFHARAA